MRRVRNIHLTQCYECNQTDAVTSNTGCLTEQSASQTLEDSSVARESTTPYISVPHDTFNRITDAIMSNINRIQEPSVNYTELDIISEADFTGIDPDQTYISSQIEYISDEEGPLPIDEQSPISFIASLIIPAGSSLPEQLALEVAILSSHDG